ncbi:hypothetical protein LLH00_05995 [bacterium]|nr:hypothetical protein [bacterium]
MILDVETALSDYLLQNMVRVVGHGNAEVPVYRGRFPQGCKPVAVMIARVGGNGDADLPDRDLASVDVWARHEHWPDALRLMQNLDTLLDGLCRKALNAEVFCLGCQRSSGPIPLDSENNDLVRYICTYEMDLRRG